MKGRFAKILGIIGFVLDILCMFLLPVNIHKPVLVLTVTGLIGGFVIGMILDFTGCEKTIDLLISSTIEAVEEIYAIAQENILFLQPSSIEILSNYSVHLFVGIKESDLERAIKVAEKGICHWRPDVYEYVKGEKILSLYTCPKHATSFSITDDYLPKIFKRFEKMCMKRIKEKHPDWYFSKDGRRILFLCKKY